jgi:phage terminase large subunit-like protein
MSDPDIGGTLAYWEWSAPAGSDIDDIEAVRAANPAFGTRINEDFLSVERAALDDDEYARERLGIFPDGDDAPQWEIIPEPVWAAAESLEGSDEGWMIGPASIGIEMPPTREMVSIASAGGCREGGEAIDLVAVIPVDEVIDLLVALTTNDDHPVRHVVVDPTGPAGALIPDLEEAGVAVQPCKYADLKVATGDFYDGMKAGEIHHRSRPVLTEAVSRAAKRTAGDTWLINRRTPHDPSPLGACVLARWGHRQPVETKKTYKAGGFR